MELTEEQIFDKYRKQCMHCLRNTLLPYENEWRCLSCGYDVIKRENELSKIRRKKNKFI